MLAPARKWIADHPTLARLVLALFGLVLFLRELSDPDIWFHLTIGREIFSSGALPATEFYVFPAASEAAHFPAAGYGLLQYLLFLAAGLPGLTVFNALVFLATLWLLYRAACAGGREPGIVATALAASVVLWGLNPRFVFRPETILFLALALELVVLERWLATGRARGLYVVPVLAWAITLLHTTWIVLLLVLGAYAAHGLVEFLRAGRGPSHLRGAAFAHLSAAGILTCLLPLANPYGLAQLQILVASFSGEANNLVEYLPIHRTEYLPHFALIGLCVAGGWGATRRIRLSDALMVAGFGILAFLSARNIALFALASFLPLVRALSEISQRRLAASHRAIACLAGLALAVAAVRSEGNWGYGVQRGSMPEAGTRMLRTHLAPCNVFNFFHFGGYLAWELGSPFKVAIDGHFVRPTAAHAAHDQFFRADANWRQLAWRYDVCAIVTPATLPYSGSLIPLVRELGADPAWRLVAAEEAALTFIRADLAREIAPLPKRLVWEQALREAEATLRAYPRQPGAVEAAQLARARLGMD